MKEYSSALFLGSYGILIISSPSEVKHYLLLDGKIHVFIFVRLNPKVTEQDHNRETYANLFISLSNYNFLFFAKMVQIKLI